MKTLALSLFLFLTVAVSAQEANISVKQANLRATPSVRGKVITTLKYEEPVEIIKESGAWLSVRAKGRVGWLHRKVIAISIFMSPEELPGNLDNPDAEIRSKIEDRIKKLGIRTITVEVKNCKIRNCESNGCEIKDCEVTLTGTVQKDRLAEVMNAVMSADDSVVKINNKLTVK